MLQQLKDKVDQVPDIVKVRYLYKQYEITTCNNPEEANDMDDGDRTIPKHGHNNPEEAAQFMEDVT